MDNINILQSKPAVPQWLIDHLKDNFKDRLPRGSQIDVGTLRYLQGQLSVVDYLETLNEDEA